jgi:hypothetical protein
MDVSKILSLYPSVLYSVTLWFSSLTAVTFKYSSGTALFCLAYFAYFQQVRTKII